MRQRDSTWWSGVWGDFRRCGSETLQGGGRGEGGSGEEGGDFIATPPYSPIYSIYILLYTPPPTSAAARSSVGRRLPCVCVGGGKGTVFGRARKKNTQNFSKMFFCFISMWNQILHDLDTYFYFLSTFCQVSTLFSFLGRGG